MTTPYHLFNRTLAVWRESTTGDSGGGQASVRSHVGTITGQLSQPTAGEREVAQRHGARLSHIFHAPPRSDVHRGDQLRDDAADLVLEVLATMSPSRPVYLRCECESRTDKEA